MLEGSFIDPEEVFGTIFGGERFVPIISHISLGKDMKTALQEVDEAENRDGERKVLHDAKGREILSEAEKARREEKKCKATEEVRKCLNTCLLAFTNASEGCCPRRTGPEAHHRAVPQTQRVCRISYQFK